MSYWIRWWRIWGLVCNKTIHQVLSYQVLHPRKLTWNLKMDPWKRIQTSTNHQFPGSMLVFRGCKLSNITASQLICHPAMRHCHQDRPWRTGSAEPLRRSHPSRHRSRNGSASGRVDVKEGTIGDPLGDPNFWQIKIHQINDERWSVCNFLYQCMVSLDSCS